MAFRAALYLRVFLDATGEYLAVDRQRDEYRALVETRGWTLVDEYVDNSVWASWRTAGRAADDQDGRRLRGRSLLRARVLHPVADVESAVRADPRRNAAAPPPMFEVVARMALNGLIDLDVET